jgi:glycosyltransferase involved in cell wall biosynthesis
MIDTTWPAVSLCIPTFRRPDGLRKLLSHVAALTYPGPLSVVVVDNDGEGRAGDAVVREMAPQFPFPLLGVVEPRAGQTYAYNAGFAAAARRPATDYVAVLDDDEFPAPNWLTEMIATAVRYKADIVGGPVFPVFEDPDNWLAQSGLYNLRRYATGPVDIIYGAGSMVIRRDVLEQYLDEPFSHAFAFTGGSDLDFFVRCRRDGKSFAWADEAHVFETTPRSRTTARWLLLRYFRKGSEAARIDRLYSSGRGAALRRWVAGPGLIGYGLSTAILTAWRGRASIMGKLLHVARGMGRIAAEFDILYEEYRPPAAANEAVRPMNSKAPRE